MAIYIKNTSRLHYANLTQIGNIVFFEEPAYPNIPRQSDDITYEVADNDRIDTIAYRFYGDPILWWVIAIANGLELLPTDISVGQTLRIPAPRYVRNQLFKG